MMIRKFVTNTLKRSSFGRLMMKPMRWVYRLYAAPHRRKLLQKRGPAVLRDIGEILRRHGIKGFAAFGTLLGIVREKGFIRHDEDIDLGIVPGSITPQELLDILLNQEQGFSFAFAFRYQDRITEIKVYYLGVPVDFFFFRDCNDCFCHELYLWQQGVIYPSEKANSVRLVYSPVVKETKDALFMGISFPIPSNEEEVLTGLYGRSWRIPNAKWSEDDRPRYEGAEDFGFSVELEDALKQVPA